MNGFTVGQKLWAGFATIVCLLLMQGYASIAAIGTFERTLAGSVKKASVSSDLVNDIHASVADMKAYAKMTQFAYALNWMLGQKSAGACTSCHAISAPDTAQREFAAIADSIHPKLKQLAEGLPAEERRTLDIVDQGTAEWMKVFGEYLIKSSAREFEAGHSIITDRMEPIRERIEKATQELELVEARSLQRSQAESVAAVRKKAFLLIGLQLAILLPTILLAWRFIRRVTAQLRALRAAACHLAAGDVARASAPLTAVGL